jgi:diamine N-acetyltransferase
MSGAAVQPIVSIVGEQVALGPLVREHVPLFVRWFNDFAVTRTFDIPMPRTIEALTATYEGQAQSGNAYLFTIYECASWRPIGRTILYDVDWSGRTADFSIVIGEADARGHGYGTETTRLMLDYAFTALGLHSVMLTTRAFNLAGQAAYRKAGFKEFGRRRECSFLDGRLHDLVYMDCLASEFVSPILSNIFVPNEPRK